MRARVVRLALLFLAVLAVASASAWSYSPWSGPGGSSATLPTGLCNPNGVAWASTTTYTGTSVVIPATASKDTGFYYVPSAGCTSGSTEPNWPNAIGLNVADGSCTWQAFGSSVCSQGANAWTTMLDCDLTAQGSQTLTTDGAYTICGKTWNKFNSAGEATHATVGGGSPLTFNPNVPVSFVFGTQNAPGVWIGFQQFNIPQGFQWQTSYRLWVYATSFGNSNASTGFGGNGMVLGLLPLSTNTTTTDRYLSFMTSYAWGFTGEWVFDYVIWQNLSSFSSTGPVSVTGSNTYPSVAMLELAPMGLENDSSVQYFALNVGPWPQVTQMQAITIWPSTTLNPYVTKGFCNLSGTLIAGNDGGSIIGNQPSCLQPGQWGMTIGAERASTAPTQTISINRVRIDYKQTNL